MNHLRKDTVLQRTPNISVHLRADDCVTLNLGSRRLESGPDTLRILDLFSQPNSVEAALHTMSPRSRARWIELTNTIRQLFCAGILQDVDATTKIHGDGVAYASPSIHVAMLNDRTRTESYLRAIAEVVERGDIVVELGTGSGVLSVAAVRAGASQVYAIEANRVALMMAEKTFADNKVADRIQLIHGWSTQVTLPQRADVMVSELIGNDPFGESVWEYTVDAVRRFLKPQSRRIPNRLKVYALTLEVPNKYWRKHRATDATLRNWRRWYGVDLRSVTTLLEPTDTTILWVKPQRVREWIVPGSAMLLGDIGFQEYEHMQIDSTATTIVGANGTVNAALIYFELDLGPTNAISTHPHRATRDNHWRCPVWLASQPLSVRAGDRLSVRYQYNVNTPGTRVRLFPGDARPQEMAGSLVR